MAAGPSMHRLLRIRELEEEQSRLAVESALARLLELRGVQAAAAERERRGRRLVEAGLCSGEMPDRVAGVEESRAAERMTRALLPKIWAAEQDIDRLRQDYLHRQVQRRQAETLVEETGRRRQAAAEKRLQEGLDEWYRHRSRGAAGATTPLVPEATEKALGPETGPPTGLAGREAGSGRPGVGEHGVHGPGVDGPCVNGPGVQWPEVEETEIEEPDGDEPGGTADPESVAVEPRPPRGRSQNCGVWHGSLPRGGRGVTS